MQKLIAFGCSITYGHGLPDCFEPPKGHGPEPSKLAWPSLLGKKLNRKTVINNGSPGAGNLEILYKILNHKFYNNDLCVVYWSFYNRIDLVRLDPSISKMYRIRLENIDKEYLAEEGYINHMVMKNFLVIHHAALFLEKKGIPYFFLDRRSQNIDRHITFPAYLKPKNYDGSQLDINFRIDLALDNLHPGVKSQEKIADYMFSKINSIQTKNKGQNNI